MDEQEKEVESPAMATPAVQPITIEQAQSTTRRQKARNRRNVWKDQSGSSIFELDSSSHVKLVCGDASTFNALSIVLITPRHPNQCVTWQSQVCGEAVPI
jgi:hypothetical protein